MAATFSSDPEYPAAQRSLKDLLQAASAGTAEKLAAALLGRLLDLPVAVAKSGFQHGGDAGPGGRLGRRFRIEVKRYADSTSLSDRELLGELDQALVRDPALEAWVLAATRAAPEQLVQALNRHGETLGVPVLILDWPDTDELAPLAALCAFAPDLVDTVVSSAAANEARTLAPIAGPAIDQIRRDLQSWSLGYGSLRDASRRALQGVWCDPRQSSALLGQDAAVGARAARVRRRSVEAALDTWWTAPEVPDTPMLVTGLGGVGKTWATLDWLHSSADEQPIVLLVPSSATAGASLGSGVGLRGFLADRLYELTGQRDREHWVRRVERLLSRPPAEGPVFTLFFDGMNQEPSSPWILLFKTLQADPFSARVRLIASTRDFHLQDKLGGLRGLVVRPARTNVGEYDLAPGGEFDEMLQFKGLTRDDLHPDLIELAKNPRLFRLVVKFRDRLVEASQVTVHRLLWEYGRDTFGERTGRSFSELKWREWLAGVARRWRAGELLKTAASMSETVARADLTPTDVFQRLSDIIDGRFAPPAGARAGVELWPRAVDHALGAALLSRLQETAAAGRDAVEAELNDWLDPISGLEQRAEILRAAVSIALERDETADAEVISVLIVGWLQTQNITDTHRQELVALAAPLAAPLLDAVERSPGGGRNSARPSGRQRPSRRDSVRRRLSGPRFRARGAVVPLHCGGRRAEPSRLPITPRGAAAKPGGRTDRRSPQHSRTPGDVRGGGQQPLGACPLAARRLSPRRGGGRVRGGRGRVGRQRPGCGMGRFKVARSSERSGSKRDGGGAARALGRGGSTGP